MTKGLNNHKAWGDQETRYQELYEAAKLLNPNLTEEQFERMYVSTFKQEDEE